MRTNAARDHAIVISTLKDGHIMTQSLEHIAKPDFSFLLSTSLFLPPLKNIYSRVCICDTFSRPLTVVAQQRVCLFVGLANPLFCSTRWIQTFFFFIYISLVLLFAAMFQPSAGCRAQIRPYGVTDAFVKISLY